MKKRIFKLLSLVLAIVLCFSQIALFSASAEEVKKVQDKYTFIDDSVYYFRDDFDLSVEGLTTHYDNQDLMPNVNFDGDWTIGVQYYDPKSTVLPYPYLETFFYRPSSVTGIYMVTPHKGKPFVDLRASIGFNLDNPEDENLYFGIGMPWEYYATLDLNFIAPQDGKIVLFDALNATIDAMPSAQPWNSFKENSDQKVTFSIWKNNTVKIWPQGDEEVYIDKDTRSIPFPDLGEIKVKAGDIITMKMTSQVGEVNGIFKLNPAVGYTELTTDNPAINTSSTNESTGNNNYANDGPDVLLIVCIAVGALLVIAAVVISVIVIKKKKIITNVSEETSGENTVE